MVLPTQLWQRMSPRRLIGGAEKVERLFTITAKSSAHYLRELRVACNSGAGGRLIMVPEPL